MSRVIDRGSYTSALARVIPAKAGIYRRAPAPCSDTGQARHKSQGHDNI